MEARRQNAHELAGRAQITFNDGCYFVPSQSGNGQYAVTRSSAAQDVAYMNLLPLQPAGGDDLVEQLPGRPDGRQALGVLVGRRRLADEAQDGKN